MESQKRNQFVHLPNMAKTSGSSAPKMEAKSELKSYEEQLKTSQTTIASISSTVAKSDLTSAELNCAKGIEKNKYSFKKKKRTARKSELQPKYKRIPGFQQPKNALMQLNELKPGLKYIFEAQQGPPHNPVFYFSVEVNQEKFVGKGKSKQLAKHAAAGAALSYFAQFPDMLEAGFAVSKQMRDIDFAAHNVENKTCRFNKFENQNYGSGSRIVRQNKFTNKLHKVINEFDKKNPIMLLNELRPGLTFMLVKEDVGFPSGRFVMNVSLGGEVFEGVGRNKKTAKAAAARSALNGYYNIY